LKVHFRLRRDNPDFSINSGARAAVNKALALWKTYTGIDFAQAESESKAEITFSYENFLLPGQVNFYGKAVTYPSQSPEAEDDVKVRFNLLKTDNKDNSWSENSFENINNNRYFRIIVHEIGHALGLTDRYTDNPFYTGMSKEVGDGIGQAGIYPGVSTDYMLPNETPMAWDILAIQYLYGVNTLTNAGNTVYGTNPTSPDYNWSDGKNHYLTIWDAGGNDTIDLSCRTDGKATIDLRENDNNGGFAKIVNSDGKVSLYAGIAFSNKGVECIIENATGTSQNDKITGNDKVNTLKGGAGDDYLEGGKGNDILEGGTGFDTYVYTIGDGNDTITDSDNSGRVLIKKNNEVIQTTTLYKELSGNIWKDATGSVTITHNSPWKIVLEDGGVIELGEEFQDGDFGIHLLDDNITTTTTIVGDLTPIPGTSSEFQYDAAGLKIANVKTDALGNVQNDGTPSADRSDYIYDSADNDRIEAGGGNDVINAERGGSDILIGGAGSDRICEYSDNGDNLLFAENFGEMSAFVAAGEIASGINEKGDLLSAGSGSDQLYGSNRKDALFGGGGNDLIVGGGGDDVILADYSVVSATRDWNVTIAQNPNGADFTNLNHQEDTAGGADNIYAGAGNDFVYAGAGADAVDGGTGADIIFGESGKDFITGGAVCYADNYTVTVERRVAA